MLLFIALLSLLTSEVSAAFFCIGNDRVDISGPNVILVFNDSVAFCEGQSAELLKVKSRAEFDLMQAFLLATFNSGELTNFPWIGMRGTGADVNLFNFYDGDTEGVDFFRTGTGIFPWIAGEPKTAGNTCVLTGNIPQFTYRDFDCNLPAATMCRFKNGCTSSPIESPTSRPTFAPTFRPTFSPTFAPAISIDGELEAPECRVRDLGIKRQFNTNVFQPV